MAGYRLLFKPSLAKDLRRLPSEAVVRILKRVESLKEQPLPPGAARLAGAEKLHRIRVGDYRVVYGVDHESRLILVHHVRHRREVYRKL